MAPPNFLMVMLLEFDNIPKSRARTCLSHFSATSLPDSPSLFQSPSLSPPLKSSTIRCQFMYEVTAYNLHEHRRSLKTNRDTHFFFSSSFQTFIFLLQIRGDRHWFWYETRFCHDLDLNIQNCPEDQYLEPGTCPDEFIFPTYQSSQQRMTLKFWERIFMDV